MPPAWMWHLDKELDAWFQAINERREEKYGAQNDNRDQVPMMRNELARPS